METQNTPVAEAVLRKKNGAGGINLPDFRLYYKVTKTVQYWHKSRNIDQWNKIESPEINPCAYGYLVFDKEGKNIQWGKAVSSISGAGKTGQLHVKKMKLKHFIMPYTKRNSKQVKDLTVRPETIKLLEENIGRTLCDVNCGKSSRIHLLE